MRKPTEAPRPEAPEGEPNLMTMHAGTPVVRGTKYVITKWYRTRPWAPRA